MQKKKQTKPIKKIIILTILAILLLLLIFAEDIIKLTNKNKINLAENTPNEAIEVEPNIPVLSAGMIPIKWENDHFVITTQEDKDWYDYKNGKPAYIMLNDGYYQSELIRDMTNKELAENSVGNDALVVPNVGNNNPTILMWIPRFAINDETNEIQYTKNVETANENWTIPEIFTHKQVAETVPDFLLTGIWFEIDVDNNYSNKITQMNSENSIYGFIKNTIALSSNQTTQNEIQNYIANTVGAPLVGIPEGSDTAVPLTIPDITNPNRVILKIINQKNQDPIKAKASYNKDTGLITVQVTYTQNGINKILLENEHELTFSKVNGIITADTTGIELEDGINAITIIDNNGNKKELKVQVMSAIYATLYTDGTLAFGKSENPLPEKTIKVKYGDISGKDYYQSNTPWYAQRTLITTVEFANKISPISTANWFYDCRYLTNIINIENLNTSNVTNMRSMFENCRVLTTLDLRTFDTKNVTNMKYMFNSCEGLTQLDVSSFNTSKVTDMSSMFYRCGYNSEDGLKELDVSNFDTSKVTNMASMFNNCSKLTKLDVSNFDTSNVTNMRYMFTSCKGLTELDLSNFDTSKVTDMSYMFSVCPKLTSLDLSNFDTTNVTNISYIFNNCTSLTQITFGENWNKEITLPTLTKACSGWYSDADFTNKVAEPAGTYAPAGPITIYANVPPDIFVKLYTDGTLAFCSNNSQIPFKELSQDYGNIGGKEYTTQNTIPWYNQRTSVITVTFIDEILPTSTTLWFFNCSNLKTINRIKNLNTSNVTDMNNMFCLCSSLTSLDLSNFETSNVTNMCGMLSNCTSLTSLDISNFDTSNVINMQAMFYGCKLTQLDLSSFDTSRVTDITNIFNNCTNLTQISFGDKWNKQVTLPTPIKEGYTCTGWYSDADFTNKVAEAGADYTPKGPITIYANIVPITYATLYTDGTLAFGRTDNPLPEKTISAKYGEIPVNGYTASVASAPWYNDSTIKTVNFVDEIYITSAYGLFNMCQNLTKVENMENLKGVTNMYSMFDSCYELSEIDVSNLDTSKVTDMRYMFSQCTKLTKLDVSKWDTSNVTGMTEMFYYCKSLTELDVTKFDTSKVTNMQYMFSVCSGLSSLDVTKFDTSNVTNMNGMFQGCSGLTELNVSNFNTSNVTSMMRMFGSCNGLAELDISNFDTRNATNMNNMFSYSRNLKTIYVGENWTTDNATTTEMFYNCGTSTVTRK